MKVSFPFLDKLKKGHLIWNLARKKERKKPRHIKEKRDLLHYFIMFEIFGEIKLSNILLSVKN